jgi:hypothetical protein
MHSPGSARYPAGGVESVSMKGFVFLSVALFLAGCQGGEPVPGIVAGPAVHFDPEGVKIMQPVPGQKFTPTSSALVAFDTRTGELCMTYDWAEAGSRGGLVPCGTMLADYPDTPRTK